MDGPRTTIEFQSTKFRHRHYVWVMQEDELTWECSIQVPGVNQYERIPHWDSKGCSEVYEHITDLVVQDQTS